MTLLIIGLCLFIGIHVVPAAPSLRGALVSVLLMAAFAAIRILMGGK